MIKKILLSVAFFAHIGVAIAFDSQEIKEIVALPNPPQELVEAHQRTFWSDDPNLRQVAAYTDTLLESLDKMIRENPDRKILVLMPRSAHITYPWPQLKKTASEQYTLQYKAMFHNNSLKEAEKVFHMLRVPTEIKTSNHPDPRRRSNTKGADWVITNPSDQLFTNRGFNAIDDVRAAAVMDYFNKKYPNVTAISKPTYSWDVRPEYNWDGRPDDARHANSPRLPKDTAHPADFGKILLDSGGIPFQAIMLYHYMSYSQYDLVIYIPTTQFKDALSTVIAGLIQGKRWVESNEFFEVARIHYLYIDVKGLTRTSDKLVEVGDANATLNIVPKLKYVKSKSKPTTFVHLSYNMNPLNTEGSIRTLTIRPIESTDLDLDGRITPDELRKMYVTNMYTDEYDLTSDPIAKGRSFFGELLNAQAGVEYVLAWFDINDDGIITREEYEKANAGYSAQRKWRKPSKLKYLPNMIYPYLLSNYDTNKDGKVTLAEVEAVEQRNFEVYKLGSETNAENKYKDCDYLPLLANAERQRKHEENLNYIKAFFIANGEKEDNTYVITPVSEAGKQMAAAKEGRAWADELLFEKDSVQVYGSKTEQQRLRPIIETLLKDNLPIIPEYTEEGEQKLVQAIIEDYEAKPVFNTFQKGWKNYVSTVLHLDSVEPWMQTLETTDTFPFSLKVLVQKIGNDYLVIDGKNERVLFKDKVAKITFASDVKSGLSRTNDEDTFIMSVNIIEPFAEEIPTEFQVISYKGKATINGAEVKIYEPSQKSTWKSVVSEIVENRDYVDLMLAAETTKVQEVFGEGYEITDTLEIIEEVYMGAYLTPEMEESLISESKDDPGIQKKIDLKMHGLDPDKINSPVQAELIRQALEHNAKIDRGEKINALPLPVAVKRFDVDKEKHDIMRVKIVSKESNNAFPAAEMLATAQNKLYQYIRYLPSYQYTEGNTFFYDYVYNADTQELKYVGRKMMLDKELNYIRSFKENRPAQAVPAVPAVPAAF